MFSQLGLWLVYGAVVEKIVVDGCWWAVMVRALLWR